MFGRILRTWVKDLPGGADFVCHAGLDPSRYYYRMQRRLGIGGLRRCGHRALLEKIRYTAVWNGPSWQQVAPSCIPI